MPFKRAIWDYAEPPNDELWRARRMAEFFPFVVEDLSEEDKRVLLKHLDKINVPEERKEFIRMMCADE